jgi:flagellar biosynthesis protein FlhB
MVFILERDYKKVISTFNIKIFYFLNNSFHLNKKVVLTSLHTFLLFFIFDYCISIFHFCHFLLIVRVTYLFLMLVLDACSCYLLLVLVTFFTSYLKLNRKKTSYFSMISRSNNLLKVETEWNSLCGFLVKSWSIKEKKWENKSYNCRVKSYKAI